MKLNPIFCIRLIVYNRPLPFWYLVNLVFLDFFDTACELDSSKIANMVGAASTAIEPVSPSTHPVCSAFFAAALYSALETFFQIFYVFKHRGGLYFWSMQIATWGIIVYVTFNTVIVFSSIPYVLASAFALIGYYCMSTAPLFVLYSRLHIVANNSRKIRWVLFLILALFLPFLVSSIVLAVGAFHRVPRRVEDLSLCMKVQITCYSVAETIFSGIYVRAAFSSLKPIVAMKGKTGKKLLVHLVVVYVVLVILLGVLIMLNDTRFFYIGLGFSPFVYSIKLKTEFAIVTRLVDLVNSRQHLPRWNLSHSSLMITFEPCPSTNPASPEQESPGRCTQRRESSLDMRETEHEEISIPESEIRISTPPKALPPDQLLLRSDRV